MKPEMPPLVPARPLSKAERLPSHNGVPPKLPQPDDAVQARMPIKLIPIIKQPAMETPQVAEAMPAAVTPQENVMQTGELPAKAVSTKAISVEQIPAKAVPINSAPAKPASTISTRESVVVALLKAIAVLEDADTKVYRNLDKPTQVPSGGLIILRDNEAAKEVDVLLSPLTQVYELAVGIEAMIQHPEANKRSLQLDLLISMLSSAIAIDRTLQNLAEHVEVQPAEFQDEPVEGAATIRSAILPILIRFFDSINP